MKKFKAFAEKWFPFLGGMSLGFAIPFGWDGSPFWNIFPIPDFYIFLPLSIVLLFISWYSRKHPN